MPCDPLVACSFVLLSNPNPSMFVLCPSLLVVNDPIVCTTTDQAHDKQQEQAWVRCCLVPGYAAGAETVGRQWKKVSLRRLLEPGAACTAHGQTAKSTTQPEPGYRQSSSSTWVIGAAKHQS
jgi:hypothetical protein